MNGLKPGAMALALAWILAGCDDGQESPGPGRAALRPPPLIVLISLDTLRADRLDLYGYARETAPKLSALARDSVVFSTVAAQATQTLISHKSLFASRYPLRLIHETTGADLEALAMAEEPQKLAERAFSEARGSLVHALRGAGYRTAAFTDGGWMRAAMGFGEGFDLYNDREGGLERIVPRVLDWLENEGVARRESPSFLFVHAYDVHCPYAAREPYDTLFCDNHGEHLELAGLCAKPDLLSMDLTSEDFRAISNHYDGGIASADAYVGELLDRLKSLALHDEAMIVVTSDHGDSLGERARVGHGGLYLEQLLVPLILKLPASWGIAGRRVEAPVELVDLMPTVLEAAGVAIPAGLDGRSLLPLIFGEQSGRRHLTAQTTYREGREAITNLAKRAILEPSRWLLIHDATGSELEIFDLKADPSGGIDLAESRPDAVPGLLSALARQDRTAGPGGGAGDPDAVPVEEFDPELVEELRALGYLD